MHLKLHVVLLIVCTTWLMSAGLNRPRPTYYETHRIKVWICVSQSQCSKFYGITLWVTLQKVPKSSGKSEFPSSQHELRKSLHVTTQRHYLHTKQVIIVLANIIPLLSTEPPRRGEHGHVLFTLFVFQLLSRGETACHVYCIVLNNRPLGLIIWAEIKSKYNHPGKQ